MPQPNTSQQPAQTGVVASPNPTVDDSKAKSGDAPKKVEGTQAQPADATTAAPMKSGKGKKPKHQKKPSGN